MFWVQNRYARVWKIFRPKNAEAKYYDLRVSTSEKKSDDEWENSDWNARAIGKAYNQIKKGDIDERSDYSIRGKITNVRWRDDEDEYHDNYRLVIMEFGNAGSDIENNDAKPAKKSDAKKPAEKKTASKPAKNEDEEEDAPW